MKYFFLVGEASGDAHAAALPEALRRKDPQAQFAGLGGPLMQAAGVKLYQDYTHMAFMGVWAILCNIPQIRENFRIAEQALLSEKPDVLILVDYPSFNLKMAEFARKHLPGIKIIYYIPPKVWAWKTHRIHRIARLCDEVHAIFPFEPAFYAKYGYQCTYVGNPTAKAVAQWQASHSAAASQRSGLTTGSETVIALLPGSRKNEIRNCLPKMLKAIHKELPNLQSPISNIQSPTSNLQSPISIVIAAAPGIEEDFYTQYLADNITLTHDTWSLLSRAKVALVASGTATLEAALLGCPQVAVYRIILSRWLGWLRPFIFKLKQFTLVNIIAGKEVIYEAIGPKFSVSNIRRELHRLLTDEAYVKNMLAEYGHIRTLMQSPQ